MTNVWSLLEPEKVSKPDTDEVSVSEFCDKRPKFVVCRRRVGSRWKDCRDTDYVKMFTASTMSECEEWVSGDIGRMTWKHPDLITSEGLIKSGSSCAAAFYTGTSDFALDYIIDSSGLFDTEP